MTSVSTRDLKVGMFVAELDRPWLETPFLLQGFLIEEQSQIDHLQLLCRTVEIDPSKSVGMFFAATVHGKDAPLAGLPPPDLRTPFAPQTREAIAAWALGKTRKQLDALAAQHDIPLHTLSN